ncbi:hypothetical protein VCRA2123O444_50062 [Vibrio crassostreae]|nr:hypothetical protein VCRA2113O409_70063 [Vibrio crassostreae]CAK2175503.1 hypothetical protein VCRA2113O414_70090 [Vibrio crassostreae]CAK2194045.1 hypothetical protein VCRA2114O421_80088 [Vibrio crassostreae]CAK2194328.1 hypothetical protein VCRA2113O411_80062 [Vibrio crassostreae]CAK2203224.1 hypothetical protein VCRA2119O432_90062 [Vibrio crassostreae]
MPGEELIYQPGNKQLEAIICKPFGSETFIYLLPQSEQKHKKANSKRDF